MPWTNTRACQLPNLYDPPSRVSLEKITLKQDASKMWKDLMAQLRDCCVDLEWKVTQTMIRDPNNGCAIKYIRKR